MVINDLNIGIADIFVLIRFDPQKLFHPPDFLSEPHSHVNRLINPLGKASRIDDFYRDQD